MEKYRRKGVFPWEFKEILGLKDPKGKEPEQYTEITALKRSFRQGKKTNKR